MTDRQDRGSFAEKSCFFKMYEILQTFEELLHVSKALPSALYCPLPQPPQPRSRGGLPDVLMSQPTPLLANFCSPHTAMPDTLRYKYNTENTTQQIQLLHLTHQASSLASSGIHELVQLPSPDDVQQYLHRPPPPPSIN